MFFVISTEKVPWSVHKSIKFLFYFLKYNHCDTKKGHILMIHILIQSIAKVVTRNTFAVILYLIIRIVVINCVGNSNPYTYCIRSLHYYWLKIPHLFWMIFFWKRKYNFWNFPVHFRCSTPKWFLKFIQTHLFQIFIKFISSYL